MRTIGALTFCIAMLVSVAATAAPRDDGIPAPIPDAGSAGGPPPGLADRDADGLSDSLQAAIDVAAPGDKFDVVVTFSAPGWNAARAGRSVGPFRAKREFRIIRGFAASMTGAQVQALAGTPAVSRIEEDFQVTVNLDGATADFGSDGAQMDFVVDGSGALLGRPIGICVIDTGVNAQHEQLDNGKVVAFFDAINGLTTPYDDHGHGTHVASIAVGDGVGGTDAAKYQGVAPGTALYVAKSLDGNGFGSDSQVIAGVEWCAAQAGVDILSISIGTVEGSDGSDSLSQATNCAADPNWSTVCATSGAAPETVGSPGAAEKPITVAAVANPSGDGRGVYLAAFSSRGPTLDGRIKPDISAPGMRIAAANFLLPTWYVNTSGTSMATPFVSGVAALMLDANPELRLTDPISGKLPVDRIRDILAATAQDRGPDGPGGGTKDHEYGFGLVDAYAAVAEASGLAPSQYSPTRLPLHLRAQGSVTNLGSWLSDPFRVAGDGTPVAATIMIEGKLTCTLGGFGICNLLGTGWGWDPDLDMQLLDADTGLPVAAEAGDLTLSECPLAGEFCGASRQETVYYLPPGPGRYQIRVYAFDGGGSFALELSGFDIGLFADAGPDQTVFDTDANGSETVTLDGSASVHNDGIIVAYEWTENGLAIATGATPTVDLGIGIHAIVLTVTDDSGNTESDNVVIDLQSNQTPLANAGPDQTIGDNDGDGTVAVTLNGGASVDPDGGSILSYQWSKDGAAVGSGQTLALTLPIGPHQFALTVIDNGGASATDTMTVTVLANRLPVADAGPDQNVSDSDGNNTEIVVLDGGASSDPDGPILSYGWTKDGSAVGSGATVSLTLAVGVHDFTLTVTDEAGQTAADAVRVTVLANQPPIADAGPDVFLTDRDGSGAEIVTLDAGGSSDPDGSSLSYAWSEGGVTIGSAATLTVTREVGTHDFTVTVTDEAGAASSDTATVIVNPDPLAPKTVFLSHLDGADGATTATDDSGKGHALDFIDTAQIDTAASHSGGASALFNGADTTFISIADSDDWHFGAGQFTVEAWVRFASLSTYSTLINGSDFATDQISWLIDWTTANQLRLLYSPDGTNAKRVTLATTWTPTVGAWHHIAVDRDANNNLRIYVDGEVLLNNVVTAAFHNAASDLKIGAFHDGWIDEVRLTKGVARYQGAFSAPNRPVTADDIVLVAHLDGPDGATTAVDESGKDHALNFAGTAQIDTAESRFGGASVLFDAAVTTFISAPDSDDWHFGAGAFTVDGWVRFASLGSYSAMFNGSDFAADQISWLVDWTTDNQLRFLYSPDGSNASRVALTAAWTPTVGAWHHVAVDRDANDNLRVYVDGKILINQVVTAAFHNAAADLEIGQFHNGWIDELRVIKGAALYAGPFTPPAAAPDFNNVVLLSHLDGADGATTANDESNGNHALSFLGVAQIDTAESRFGGASALFDAAGTTLISVPDSDDWHFGAAPFTVEAWVQFASLGSYSALFNGSDFGASQISWLIDWTTANQLRFLYSPDGTNASRSTLATAWTPTVGAWHHIAVDRDNSGRLRIYVDGAVLLEADVTAAFHNAATDLKIGAPHDGWIDELRVSKGVAQYGGPFVPPDAPHPGAAATAVAASVTR